MKAKLADMDQFIDRKKAELAQKLCEKKDEAIKKIDEKIEKMKAEMSGLVSKLGNLLLEAALKFFKWALKKAGYNTSQLMNIIDKGKAVIKKIVGDPIGFLGNIIDAVKLGIDNFKNNIKKHLVGGLINWLTGAMGDVGIQLPTKFDLKGILSIVLQILGLTWANIRTKLVKRLGEKVVSMVEKSVDIVKKIITEGPMALWEMLKAKAAEIKAQVMEGIRNWAIVELVKQGIIKLISFLNPVGAIVQAILAIYNTIMFFVENWDRIVTFVKTVFNSIVDIAMGKISAAAAAVERALAMTIPIILNFLARLLGLSGIGKTIKNIIQKIRKPIDKVLNKAINFIVKKAKSLFKKGKAKAKAVVKKGIEKAKKFIFPKLSFKAKDKTHTLLMEKKGKRGRLVIQASPGTPVQEYVWKFKERINKVADATKKTKAENEYDKAKKLAKVSDSSLNKVFNPKKAGATAAEKTVIANSKKLLTSIKKLWGYVGVPNDLLKGEAEVGPYKSLSGAPNMTPHHMPQNGILKRLKTWLIAYMSRPPVKGFREHMSNRLAGLGVKWTAVMNYKFSDGITFQMERKRHGQTRTYGQLPADLDIPQGKWSVQGKQAGDERITRFVNIAKTELQKDKRDVKAIYAGKKGLPEVKDQSKVNSGLNKVSSDNTGHWGSFLG